MEKHTTQLILTESVESADAEVQEPMVVDKKSSETRQLEVIYQNQLQEPEPLTDIPSDLFDNYYCVPFPTGTLSALINTYALLCEPKFGVAGQRCLVIASEGRTTSRRKNGSLIGM